MNFIDFLQRNIFFRNIIRKFEKARANYVIDKITCFLKKGDYVLDIGSGTCHICEALSKNGYETTPLDIRNLSFINNIKPVLYDGNTIPFDDDQFDVALFLTVLHHTPDPEKLLKEAKRVSKRILIIEDIYTNKFHKYLTYFFDSLLNLEFINHPHTNKNDTRWKETFKLLGLKLIDTKYSRSVLVFKRATYFLEK